MPLFIISAKVCPDGAEATVFAMITSLGNFGESVSSYVGASLLSIFSVSRENYDNLKWVIVIKMCCRSLILLLIPYLIPWGCPNDPPDSSNTAASKGNYGNGPCLVGESVGKSLDSSVNSQTLMKETPVERPVIKSNSDSFNNQQNDIELSVHIIGDTSLHSSNHSSSSSSHHRVNNSTRGMTPIKT